MALTDFQLIQWYRKGYYDEVYGSTSSPPEGDATASYLLGARDRSVESKTKPNFSRTDEQILKRIKP